MIWRSILRKFNLFLGTIALSTIALFAQQPITFQYFYDDLNQLVRVVDSTGVSVQYVYDAVGNLTQINRSTAAPGALTIFNITPTTAVAGGTITIQGQGFSPTASLDIVTIGGVQATVLSATSTTLVVAVPPSAASGVISVTVGSATARSGSNETIISAPIITSVRPHVAQAGTTATVTVTGANLSGATFSVSQNTAVTVSASVSADGTSATLVVIPGANVAGSFAIVASAGTATSSFSPTPANSFGIFTDPTGDPDNDGLANAFELLLGTNPYLEDTDGDSFRDGVEVASGSDPLNVACTPLNCRLPGGETDSVASSVLNTIGPPGVPSAVSNEADSVSFSVLNAIGSPGIPSASSNEADSVTFSVLNAVNPPSLLSEAESFTFSICNGGAGACSAYLTSMSRPLRPESTSVSSPPRAAYPLSLNHDLITWTRRPTVLAVAPSLSARDVSTRIPITLIFSQPMDASTLTAANLAVRAGDQTLNTEILVSSDFRAASLVTNLPPDSEITVAASEGVQSVLGRPLREFDSHFRTAAANDVPVLIQQFPAPGAGNVPADAAILLSGVSANENVSTDSLQLIQDGRRIQGTIAGDDTHVRFTPDSPFAASAAVDLLLSATPPGDNSRLIHSGAFVVAGSRNTAATPVRVYPGSASSVSLSPVVEIEFDRPLDPATVTPETVSLSLDSGDAVPASVTLLGDRVIRLRPLAPLTASASYYYEVSSRVRELNGAAAVGLRRSFVTSQSTDARTAQVREVIPMRGAKDVDLGSPVVVRFDKPINPISVTPSAILLTTTDRGMIPTTIAFGEDFKEIVLSPLEPMPAGSVVTLTVSGIEDGSGQIMVPSISRFSTASIRGVKSNATGR